MKASTVHVPVMLNQVLEEFKTLKKLNKPIVVIDSTLGQAGHSYPIFKLMQTGVLISLDLSKEALLWVEKSYNFSNGILEEEGKKWFLFNDNFTNLDEYLNELGFDKFDFLVADLGFCNMQLHLNLGISHKSLYQKLDMRYGNSNVTASKVLNSYSIKDLTNIFCEFGQIEKNTAAEIASQILKTRFFKTFVRVKDLNQLLNKWGNGIKVKVYQALRSFVNNEPQNLRKLLDFVKRRMDSEGIALIITFNPLEENILQEVWGEHIIIEPNIFEIIDNVQARTAKLHIYKKL